MSRAGVRPFCTRVCDAVISTVVCWRSVRFLKLSAPELSSIYSSPFAGHALGLCALRGQRLHRRGGHRFSPSYTRRRGRVVSTAAAPGHLPSRMSCQGPSSITFQFCFVSLMFPFHFVMFRFHYVLRLFLTKCYSVGKRESPCPTQPSKLPVEVL